MTITQKSTAISFHNSNSLNLSNLWKFIQLGTTQLKILWWHIHAYGTILGVMLLTLSSLIYLIIHHFLNKLLPALTHRDEWKISSIK
ncbi:hypothetical protein [Nostoc sp. PA-18-2419]|uniref:hypothetical protein n=1 Tax=Nostoc sp. PA-18-2419 TaxID=2575443 RepID=UPI001107AFBF|nr:hypothetical protein [Nostoc sp. PA-18-2419]